MIQTIEKSSIPINKMLLNKYSDVEEIFKKEKINKKSIHIKNIKILENININELNVENLKRLAILIFNKYHNVNIFENEGYKIHINKTGINESVQKIYFSKKQKIYLKEHLLIFSNLGKIIEQGILINQVYERKGRVKYKSWNYYVSKVSINNKEYMLEFEIVTMKNLKNVYRIQRLMLIEKTNEQLAFN